MKVKLIKTEEDYNIALARIEALTDAVPGTAEGDERDMLAVVVEWYTEEHYPLDSSKRNAC